MKLIQQVFWMKFLFAQAKAIEEESSVQRLRRNLQVAAKNVGRNQSGGLSLCEGDCNTNADCRGDLVCFQRDAGDNVPGCTLSDRLRSSRMDFCVANRQGGTPPVARSPNATPVAAPPTSSGATRASYVGNDNVSDLKMCEGDCDRDTDCARGLKCFQRSRGEGTPGCTMSQSLMNSDNDFCVREQGGANPPPPVASPVRAPPSGSTFALKLYWEPGYDWQNETFERKWCMSCRGRCSNRGEIAIFNCDDSPTKWEFVSHGPNEVQIKVANSNLCVEEFPDNDLELSTCDSSNQKQRFVASSGSFHDRRFEISPKHRQGWCFTNRHHPRSNESVNIEPCVTARRKGSDTSYWNKY